MSYKLTKENFDEYLNIDKWTISRHIVDKISKSSKFFFFEYSNCYCMKIYDDFYLVKMNGRRYSERKFDSLIKLKTYLWIKLNENIYNAIS